MPVPVLVLGSCTLRFAPAPEASIDPATARPVTVPLLPRLRRLLLPLLLVLVLELVMALDASLKAVALAPMSGTTLGPRLSERALAES